MRESAARAKVVESALRGGLFAGILDGADALIFSYAALGVTPIRLLQYIASGLLGVSAFRGGWHTALIGAGIHFSIATAAAGVYSVASSKFPALSQRPLLFGAAFGLTVYAFMHYVVLPLSFLPKRTIPVTPLETANLLFSHVFFLGIPIALIVKRVGTGGMRRPALDRTDSSR